MMNRTASSLGIFLATFAFASAADKDVEALLAKMRSAYSGAKTAKLTVKTTGARFGKDAATTEVTYMRERKIYARTTGAGPFDSKPRVFISDGEKTSFSDFSGNVMVVKFDLDVIPIPVNLEAMSFWDWKRQLSTAPGANMEKSKFKLTKSVSWNGKSWTVLGETAHGQNVYVDYYVDPKSFLIHRVQVYDLQKSQLRIETEVVQMTINGRVDAGLFKIKAAKVSSDSYKIKF